LIRAALLLVLWIGILGFSRAARAEVLEAPVGAKPIPLGEARVACSAGAGGWLVDPTGHVVRPPAATSAVGTAVDLKVAATAGDCPSSAAFSVKLVATAPWPTIDPASIALALDDGHLEVRGRELRGLLVSWPGEHGLATDACRDPRADGATEVCTFHVPKSLSADPTAGTLRWWPAGAQPSSDAVVFNVDGKRAPSSSFFLAPARVEITQLIAGGASVDVSGGVGFVPLSHPEGVANVECGVAKCAIENGNLAVQAPPASVNALDVKVHLVNRIVFARKTPAESQPVFHLSILRCPMEVASGPALRNMEGARVVVRLEGGCARDVQSLSFFVGARHVEVIQTEAGKDAKDPAFAVLAAGSIDAPSISITAVRGDGDGTVVAVTRAETRPPPIVRTVLELAGYHAIDFIPNNRPAIVHYPKIQGAELALLSLENVYVARNENGVASVQGDANAAGSVALQFAYRVPTLPPPLDKVDLGVITDSLQRNVKEANIPAPFGVTASSPTSLIELVCTGRDNKVVRVEPGVVTHVSFRERDGCRVVLHRERLSPQYGTQKLVLGIDVIKVDGTPRAESRVDQTFVMRAGDEPRVAWIKGVLSEYDRVIVKLSHAPDESHYLGATELIGAAPVAQWTLVFGTGRVRLYATTAIPTGLYRFGDSTSSGVMSLSFGVISRFTWLDTDGKEGLLALEAGLMAFGLTGDTATGTTQALTQVGAVTGVGLSIPIANPGAPNQAAINLHAWFEQRITGGPGSEQALIFGPSISLGNVGTTF